MKEATANTDISHKKSLPLLHKSTLAQPLSANDNSHVKTLI